MFWNRFDVKWVFEEIQKCVPEQCNGAGGAAGANDFCDRTRNSTLSKGVEEKM
jgi:hypothetical protein